MLSLDLLVFTIGFVFCGAVGWRFLFLSLFVVVLFLLIYRGFFVNFIFFECQLLVVLITLFLSRVQISLLGVVVFVKLGMCCFVSKCQRLELGMENRIRSWSGDQEGRWGKVDSGFRVFCFLDKLIDRLVFGRWIDSSLYVVVQLELECVGFEIQFGCCSFYCGSGLKKGVVLNGLGGGVFFFIYLTIFQRLVVVLEIGVG